tara:strand:+ start:352 stop:1542 length:1191 start_codon:yes stop_codon:yes gene_type:complete
MNEEFGRISKVRPLMQSLYRFAKENLAFKPDASIAILKDNINANNPLGKTAYYDPANHKISLYTQGRHVKDVMRSLSHELVHHAQNCRGDFDGGIATVDGYAQEDGHLREMEREAYETGNLIFRDWEDGLKAETNNGGLFTGRSLGEKLMENRISEVADKTLVDEIVLTMTNDGDFYRETIQPWIKNFRRKIKRGVFDEAEALKAFETYVAKDALKKYSIDQAGDPNYWKQIGKEDRQAIAGELLDNYMEEIQYIEEQKNMGNPETELREIIRGLVKEMLVSVKEDSGACSEDNPGPCETAEADEEGAEAASTAALGGVQTSNDGERERDEPYQTQAEAKDPGGGDKADVEEEDEGVEKEKKELDESFFPVSHDIREVARRRTNDALMKRWGYNKK